MSIFKTLTPDERISTKTLLHEAIPITGAILSGTYNAGTTEFNIKNFAHGMFQSVYDYPYLSSSANHIFDISVGTSAQTQLTVLTSAQKSKKDNIYNQMAQILSGYDKDGNIQRFDQDGNITGGGVKIDDAIFLSFSRLLVKDEIKKGSFELELGISGSYTTDTFGKRIKIIDHNAQNSFKINSPAGEYGILYATASTAAGDILDPTSTHKVTLSDGNTYWYAGLLYYQAGVAVLTSSILATTGALGGHGLLVNLGDHHHTTPYKGIDFDGSGNPVTASLQNQQISASADNLRHRMYNLKFNNTIELNSTVYFCRAKHNEFNYSSNPTYLSGSQIRVKSQQNDPPISYITSIGLYSADNQLLAVGKFSEPIRKDNSIELTFRARLDY